MQSERDILSRLIFPRLRLEMASRGFSLREIDLRWGVTETMALDGGAIGICLDGIEDCVPFVLGMLGHRFGWVPEPELLERFSQARDIPNACEASLTELELTHAERTLGLAGSALDTIPVMMRSARLSNELGHHGTDANDRARAHNLRERIAKNPATRIYAYDTLAEFEQLAYAALEQLLANDLQIQARIKSARSSRRIVDRKEISSALSKYAFTGSPMLILGAPGAGISTLLSEWRHEEPSTIRLDGRRNELGDMAGALEAAAGIVSGMPSPQHRAGSAMLALAKQGGKNAVIIDHIETAALTQSRVEISWIPVHLGTECAIVVATTNDRLAEQADELGWQIIEMPPVRPGEITAASSLYLGDYCKVLTKEQEGALAQAPWAGDFTSTRLALDELRRHGSFETLDRRLDELIGCDRPTLLVDEVVRGLAQTLPAPWCDVFRPLLVAIGASWKGLTQDEILVLGGSLAGRDPVSGSMPVEVWNAMTIAADMLLTERGDTTDLRQGQAENWVDAALSQDSDLAAQVIDAYGKALPIFPKHRSAEEGPRLAMLAAGERGLLEWLAISENAAALLASGDATLAAWLENLPVESIEHLSRAWRDADGLADTRNADLLAALSNFDRDENAAQPPPYVEREGENLIAYWHTLTANAASGDRMAADALLVWGEWIARGRKSVGDAGLHNLREAIALLNGSMTEPHWLIHSLEVEGQLGLLAMRPREALEKFQAMEVLARQTGMAAKLCSALERQAAATLELGKFRKARRKSSDCLEIARSSGIRHYEALAYERLIEVEQRRANWDLAYEVAAQYLRRARDGAVSSRRARAALDALEQGA